MMAVMTFVIVDLDYEKFWLYTKQPAFKIDIPREHRV